MCSKYAQVYFVSVYFVGYIAVSAHITSKLRRYLVKSNMHCAMRMSKAGIEQ